MKSRHSSTDLQRELRTLKQRATSDDWHVREDAGFALRDLMETYFDDVLAATEDWPDDTSDRVRRASCLSCMQRKAKTEPKRVVLVLKRIERHMTDDSVYVRKCCGPFVVGYLGYTYPDITLPWLMHQASDGDLNRRANVAKAFSQALGRKFPVEGARTLMLLSSDGRTRVRSAVLASVRNVARVAEGRSALDTYAPDLCAAAGLR